MDNSISQFSLQSHKTLPQQSFAITTVALISGTSFALTLAPLADCLTSRLEVNGIGYLQAPNSLHSTRVQITNINNNVVTVTSIPSRVEDPEDDDNVVVDLTPYQTGTAYFCRKQHFPVFWRDFWGW
jgi:hypothetical protein